MLYVAYQSKTDLRGDYMLCVLFKSYLILAIPKVGSTQYSVMAIISLSDIQIDKPDNGRGKQKDIGKWTSLNHLTLHRFTVPHCAIRMETSF